MRKPGRGNPRPGSSRSERSPRRAKAIQTGSGTAVGDPDVVVLGEANDHRHAAAPVVANLALADQRAASLLSRAAFAAAGQADRHADRAAGLGARHVQNRLVGRLSAAAAMLAVTATVVVRDAGVRRAACVGSTAGGLSDAAARLSSTDRLGTAGWLGGTAARLNRTAGRLSRHAAAGLGSTAGLTVTLVMEETGAGAGSDNGGEHESSNAAGKVTGHGQPPWQK